MELNPAVAVNGSVVWLEHDQQAKTGQLPQRSLTRSVLPIEQIDRVLGLEARDYYDWLFLPCPLILQTYLVLAQPHYGDARGWYNLSWYRIEHPQYLYELVFHDGCTAYASRKFVTRKKVRAFLRRLRTAAPINFSVLRRKFRFRFI